MPSLDDQFRDLVTLLKTPRGLSAGGGDPFYYLVHQPQHLFELRQLLPTWEGRLVNGGFAPVTVSFSDLIWGLIDRSGRWESWLEVERAGEADPADINDAVRSVLQSGEALVERVAEVIAAAPSNGVVLLTDTHALHPFFRARGLESRLHDRVTCPTVILYPGSRVGQYGLRFLDLYPEDSNYRATIVGGTP